MVGPPSLKDVDLEGPKDVLELQFSTCGDHGCVYQVTSPTWTGEHAVAKTPRSRSKKTPDEVIIALVARHELLYSGMYQGQHWIVTQQRPGVLLENTQAGLTAMGAEPWQPNGLYLFSDRQEDFERCEAFLKYACGQLVDVLGRPELVDWVARRGSIRLGNYRWTEDRDAGGHVIGRISG